MLKDGVWRSSTHQCGPSCTTKCPTHACWFPAQSQHFYCFSVICSLHHSALSIIFSSQLTQVEWWPHEAQHVGVRARNHSAGQRAFSRGSLAVLLCPWDGALSQLNQNIRHPCAVCILHSIAADGFITYKCIQGLLLCSVANPISHCFNSLSWPCFLIPLECRSALLCFFCACFLISHPLSPSQLPLSQCNPFVSESLALISDFPSTSSTPTLIFLISPPTISPPSLGAAPPLPLPAYEGPLLCPKPLSAAQHQPGPGLLLPGGSLTDFLYWFPPSSHYASLRGTCVTHSVRSASKYWFLQSDHSRCVTQLMLSPRGSAEPFPKVWAASTACLPLAGIALNTRRDFLRNLTSLGTTMLGRSTFLSVTLVDLEMHLGAIHTLPFPLDIQTVISGISYGLPFGIL